MQGITIFSDGASKGNPGPGGWGAIVVADGKVVELGAREAHTTNNRMEMTAAIEALRYVSKLEATAPIVFHTDSSYVIRGVTEWVGGWQGNGWRTKQKQDVLNKELWQELAELANALDIEWKHVRGHVGIAGNERADEIASTFAEGGTVALYSGSQEKYSRDLSNVTYDAVKKESRTRSRAAAYSYVSEVNGEVQTHKTWKECEARVKGRKARFKKALSAEDEARIVKDFSS